MIHCNLCDQQGKQKQSKRTETFTKFSNCKTGILLCTDVAARGLDIPEVSGHNSSEHSIDFRDVTSRFGSIRVPESFDTIQNWTQSVLAYVRDYSHRANKTCGIEALEQRNIWTM